MRQSFSKDKGVVVLVCSSDQGRPAWWYVKCKSRIDSEKLKGVCRLGTKETIPLNEYGEIIASGWGETPPEEIKKEIEEQYS